MQIRGQQKRTFLPYERGILPEDLRLGSLYINPLEPTDGLGSTRFEYRDDLEEQEEYEKHIRQWTRKEEKDLPFSIQFERSQVRSADIGFSSWIGLSSEREKATLVTLQGASGRRSKIKRPEDFLEEVFKQPGLEKWVRKHASIAYKSKHGRHRWNAPELWLVTGVQYVTGGAFHFEANTSNQTAAHGGGDLGVVAGAPPGVFNVKAEVSRERSSGAQNDFGHEDERVWAAQFMPVKIEFGAPVDVELSNEKKIYPKTISQFHLEDVPDLTLQGFRTSQGQTEGTDSLTPELVGRIAAEENDFGNRNDDDSDSSPNEGLIIDDRPYVTSIQNTNWEMYEEGLKYLKTAEQSRRSRSRD